MCFSQMEMFSKLYVDEIIRREALKQNQLPGGMLVLRPWTTLLREIIAPWARNARYLCEAMNQTQKIDAAQDLAVTALPRPNLMPPLRLARTLTQDLEAIVISDKPPLEFDDNIVAWLEGHFA